MQQSIRGGTLGVPGGASSLSVVARQVGRGSTKSAMRITCLTWLLLSVIALPAAAPVPAHGVGDGLLRVTKRAYGVEFHMWLSRQVYQQGSLVRVHVGMRNVSHRDVPMAVTWFCPLGRLWAEDDDVSGHSLYPPAVPSDPSWMSWLCNPDFPTVPLHPGQMVERSVLVPLRGPDLVKMVPFVTGPERPGNHVITNKHGILPAAKLHIPLRPATSAPSVTVVSGPGREASFVPPAGARGPLYYEYFVGCGTSAEIYFNMDRWHAAAGTTVVLQVPSWCTQVREWHLVAGWENYRLAQIGYSAIESRQS